MKLVTALYGLLIAPALACDLDGSYADAQRTLHGAEVWQNLEENLA